VDSAIHDWTEAEVPNDEAHMTLRDRLAVRSRGTHVPAPDELVQVIERLGYGDDAFVCGHSSESFDHETGISSWRVTLATDSVLVEATAEAARMSTNRGTDEQNPIDWTLVASDTRTPNSYRLPPKVKLRIRRLESLLELRVAADGTTDSFEDEELVRETWTFTFRDGSDPVVFEVDHGDRDHPSAIDDLCRHLAGRL